ncbi:2-amino-4-hydroxy-6-hydroxymethyldihydropteridine diphosphokinase [Opacimonas viscosa]|uniref:2-amino-4-hydroxy-6-hydroxymethyldihydropteridine diphosphokinase n=1 Tax=Opacimonas viscosa TaxID=2961944 RepID=A0AA41X1R5_9ALTE|nr:2-amino-4-hydroxy-6-hydroxymethyldihydropteridine diphosphokinase [Opacimonas viscosa]MCP3427873.1 2-amino-4-hydroxy-6-hydroxymethyldihydropteridine diphosphokinase [Opacimonas viscosa]
MPQQHHILISIGSNINREYYTQRGLQALHNAFAELTLSPTYETAAVGFNGSPFYNLVASAYTDLSITEVNAVFKQIEQDNDRVRSEEKYAARTLDIDLLTYDDVVSIEPIVLPRPEITFHAFCLRPMADLVPDLIHPGTGQTYQAMWDAFSAPEQKLWQVDIQWSIS